MPQTIAILSPGDMGHAVGRELGAAGYRVVTCLAGRSERTRGLSAAAGIADVSRLQDLVEQADLVMSILVPSEAEALAGRVAAATRATGTTVTFADCNAVSPATSARIESAIAGAGSRYIDASIIGPPPGKGSPPRFYTSGPYAHQMDDLDGQGIVVRNMGAPTGAASAIKMCYAGFTKGTSALSVGVLTMAIRLGVSEELDRELSESQSAGLERMRREIPALTVKARRWVGEMEEIAATFESVALPPGFHDAAADVYRIVGQSAFADETPETLDESRDLWTTVEGIASRMEGS
ncbi:MAG: DUF1932 domain-containing protein [Dehalococcoidia bacterium]|nr:DUF1932 domain-containing protein [Dehalococcoidia bacterium]